MFISAWIISFLLTVFLADSSRLNLATTIFSSFYLSLPVYVIFEIIQKYIRKKEIENHWVQDNVKRQAKHVSDRNYVRRNYKELIPLIYKNVNLNEWCSKFNNTNPFENILYSISSGLSILLSNNREISISLIKEVLETEKYTPDENTKNLLHILKVILEVKRVKQLPKRLLHFDFDELDGSNFEKLVARHYKLLGRDVSHTGKSFDNGVDLIVSPSNDHVGLIIQCKRYKGKIGSDLLHGISGATRLSQYSKYQPVIVTNSVLTGPAKEYAINAKIKVIEREEFIEMISKTIGHSNLIKAYDFFISLNLNRSTCELMLKSKNEIILNLTNLNKLIKIYDEYQVELKQKRDQEMLKKQRTRDFFQGYARF